MREPPPRLAVAPQRIGQRGGRRGEQTHRGEGEPRERGVGAKGIGEPQRHRLRQPVAREVQRTQRTRATAQHAQQRPECATAELVVGEVERGERRRGGGIGAGLVGCVRLSLRLQGLLRLEDLALELLEVDLARAVGVELGEELGRDLLLELEPEGSEGLDELRLGDDAVAVGVPPPQQVDDAHDVPRELRAQARPKRTHVGLRDLRLCLGVRVRRLGERCGEVARADQAEQVRADDPVGVERGAASVAGGEAPASHSSGP